MEYDNIPTQMTQYCTSHNEQNGCKIKLFSSRKETTRIIYGMKWGICTSMTDPLY